MKFSQNRLFKEILKLQTDLTQIWKCLATQSHQIQSMQCTILKMQTHSNLLAGEADNNITNNGTDSDSQGAKLIVKNGSETAQFNRESKS